jgi:hypothetical protein
MKGQYYPQQDQGPRIMVILIEGIIVFLGLLLLWIIPSYLMDLLNSTGLFEASTIANATTTMNTTRVIGGILALIGMVGMVIEVRR